MSALACICLVAKRQAPRIGAFAYSVSTLSSASSHKLVAARQTLPKLAGSLSAKEQRRGFIGNIFSSMTAGFKDKKVEKQRELTLWQLNHVCNLPQYGMREHIDMLVAMTEKSGLNSLMTNLVTTVSKDQKAQLEEQTIGLRIAKALLPSEVERPSCLRSAEKLRVAAEVGCDIAKVNSFVQGYEQTKMMNEWIAGRRARALPLPTTLEEYFALVQQDKVSMGGDFRRRQVKDGMRRGGLRGVLRKELRGGGGGR